jgi:hypothetical protein
MSREGQEVASLQSSAEVSQDCQGAGKAATAMPPLEKTLYGSENAFRAGSYSSEGNPDKIFSLRAAIAPAAMRDS